MLSRFGRYKSYFQSLDETTVRAIVVLTALVICFIRMPEVFTHPQFWGEDGGIFFGAARERGWHSLREPVPGIGYFTSLQRLVAIAGSYFPTLYVPTLYNAAAIGFTLIVVWMTTSPRFDMPMRPLLAIAIVVVPAGNEVLGTMTNLQWIVPIGAFVILFMRQGSVLTLVGEALLIALVAFTGPFSLFLAPLFAWRWFAVRREPAAGPRLLFFTAILVAGAVTQIVILAINHDVAFSPGALPSVPYQWTQWFNIPLSIFLGNLGSKLFSGTGYQGAALFAVLLPLVLLFSVWQPNRQQKIAMLIFGTIVMLSGMVKYRASLPLLNGSSRYFYIMGVFGLWFVCCLPADDLWRKRVAMVVIIAEIYCLAVTVNTPRAYITYQWPDSAALIDEGKGAPFPVSPGWMIRLKPTP